MTPSSSRFETGRPEPIDMSSISNSLLDQMKTRFAKAGLPIPPRLDEFGNAWLQINKDAIATCAPVATLYDLHAFLNEAEAADSPDYAALGFDGHGVNSQALHFYIVRGPVAIFLQLKWGNVFDNVSDQLNRIEGAFSLANQLLERSSVAYAEGRFPPGQRMIVKVSDFSESGWHWAGQPDSLKTDGEFTLLAAITNVMELSGDAAPSADDL